MSSVYDNMHVSINKGKNRTVRLILGGGFDVDHRQKLTTTDGDGKGRQETERGAGAKKGDPNEPQFGIFPSNYWILY